MIPPTTVTRQDHQGGGKCRIARWDGSKFAPVTDWFSANQDVVWAEIKGRRPNSRSYRQINHEGHGSTQRCAMSLRRWLEQYRVVYDSVFLAVKGVSIDVPESGLVALLGANGAGKSTVLKSISGLLRAERGEVSRGQITFRDGGLLALDPPGACGVDWFTYWKGDAYSSI